MNQQQWNPVVFRKGSSSASGDKANGRRCHNSVGHKLGRLDEDTGAFDRPKSTNANRARAFRSKLQSERMRIGMSQRELARKLNLPESLLKQYENGQTVPENQTISRIERLMGCTLPRVRGSK